MALSCGHRAPNDERRLERYKDGKCPICDVVARRVHVGEPTAHVYCECCDECWLVVDDEVKSYFHG